MAQLTQVAIGMSQTPGMYPLTLGAIAFNSSECPEDLPIGLEQMLVEHTLVGGSRVIQAFGVKPQDITWTGRLFGTFVASRIAQLRLYVVAGQPIDMRWQGQEAYRVLVKDFVPKFHGGWAEYSITLSVLNDLSGALYAAAPTSLDQQVSALQTSANALVADAAAVDVVGTSAIQTANAGVNTALTNAAPVSQNAATQGPDLQAALTTAIAAVAAYQATLSPTSSLMPTIVQLGSTYSLISKNVTVGTSTQTLELQGGNLFSIAAQYYGDASQAFTLMAANGLHSPFLPSAVFTTVTLPPLS